MVRSQKDSGEEKQSAISILTDAQFDELKKLLQNYLKLVAMTAIKDMSEETLERDARMLDTAGFNQKEIGEILNVSQPTVARVLAGKWRKRKEQK